MFKPKSASQSASALGPARQRAGRRKDEEGLASLSPETQPRQEETAEKQSAYLLERGVGRKQKCCSRDAGGSSSERRGLSPEGETGGNRQPGVPTTSV